MKKNLKILPTNIRRQQRWSFITDCELQVSNFRPQTLTGHFLSSLYGTASQVVCSVFLASSVPFSGVSLKLRAFDLLLIDAKIASSSPSSWSSSSSKFSKSAKLISSRAFRLRTSPCPFTVTRFLCRGFWLKRVILSQSSKHDLHQLPNF